MTPADEQLGERFKALEVGQVGLDRRLTEMGDGLDRRLVEVKEGNETEHGEVKGILVEIRDEMAKKADKTEVKEVADRTDSLESFKDKLWFIIPGVTLAGTFLVGFLLHITGGGS